MDVIDARIKAIDNELRMKAIFGRNPLMVERKRITSEFTHAAELYNITVRRRNKYAQLYKEVYLNETKQEETNNQEI